MGVERKFRRARRSFAPRGAHRKSHTRSRGGGGARARDESEGEAPRSSRSFGFAPRNRTRSCRTAGRTVSSSRRTPTVVTTTAAKRSTRGFDTPSPSCTWMACRSAPSREGSSFQREGHTKSFARSSRRGTCARARRTAPRAARRSCERPSSSTSRCVNLGTLEARWFAPRATPAFPMRDALQCAKPHPVTPWLNKARPEMRLPEFRARLDLDLGIAARANPLQGAQIPRAHTQAEGAGGDEEVHAAQQAADRGFPAVAARARRLVDNLRGRDGREGRRRAAHLRTSRRARRRRYLAPRTTPTSEVTSGTSSPRSTPRGSWTAPTTPTSPSTPRPSKIGSRSCCSRRS